MIAVTGASGQLGLALRKTLPQAETRFYSSSELDITNPDSVFREFQKIRPATVINCAAYTAVDRAETEIEKAKLVNGTAVGELGKIGSSMGFRVIHVSTDFVFDGAKSQPYSEADGTAPLCAYGLSKRMGERMLLASGCRATIIRTSWLYSRDGSNFFNTMLRLANSSPEIRVVFDQLGTPTFALDLARAITQVLPAINDDSPQILHYSSEGTASWYDFAHAIFEMSGTSVNLQPIRSADYPTPAKRPSYSVLDKALIKQSFGIKIPHWREGLKECLSQF